MNHEIAERVTTANHLWLIADELREERLMWRHPAMRSHLEHAVDQTEDTARRVIGMLDLEHADAMTDAAQLTLRYARGLRKFLENLEPQHGDDQ